MATWRHTLELSDIFDNENMSFENRRDEIVKRIRDAKFYDIEDYDLVNLIDELAETDDEFYFEQVWDVFYDYAEDARIWINTF